MLRPYTSNRGMAELEFSYLFLKQNRNERSEEQCNVFGYPMKTSNLLQNNWE